MTENQAAKAAHHYVMNPESVREMERLTIQGQLITAGMGGVFFAYKPIPELPDVISDGETPVH